MDNLYLFIEGFIMNANVLFFQLMDEDGEGGMFGGHSVCGGPGG